MPGACTWQNWLPYHLKYMMLKQSAQKEHKREHGNLNWLFGHQEGISKNKWDLNQPNYWSGEKHTYTMLQTWKLGECVAPTSSYKTKRGLHSFYACHCAIVPLRLCIPATWYVWYCVFLRCILKAWKEEIFTNGSKNLRIQNQKACDETVIALSISDIYGHPPEQQQ